VPGPGERPAKTGALLSYAETVVEKMLQLGGLKTGEKMFDLVAATGASSSWPPEVRRRFDGVEFDQSLWKQSTDRSRASDWRKRLASFWRHHAAGLQLADC